MSSAISDFVHDQLSPKDNEKQFITDRYEEIRKAFPGCFQVGSYKRCTSIHPVHDLDVVIPVDDAEVMNFARNALHSIQSVLEAGLLAQEVPLPSVEIQTHSVMLLYPDAPYGEFSIDLVPAVDASEPNTFGEAMYYVPEVVVLNNHDQRRAITLKGSAAEMGWIKTDPRGYNKAALEMDYENNHYRHTVKLLKGWKHATKEASGNNFRLKSFHLEQLVFLTFKQNSEITTTAAAVATLARMPGDLQYARIKDRADPNRLIDSYLDDEDYTEQQRRFTIGASQSALELIRKLSVNENEDFQQSVLKELMQGTMPAVRVVPSVVVVPSKPYAE